MVSQCARKIVSKYFLKYFAVAAAKRENVHIKETVSSYDNRKASSLCAKGKTTAQDRCRKEEEERKEAK